MSNTETCCRTLSLFFQRNEIYACVCMHTRVNIRACVRSCCFFPRYPLNLFLPNLAAQSVEMLAVPVSYKCHENRQPGRGGRTTSAPAGGEAAPRAEGPAQSSAAPAPLPAPLYVLQPAHATHAVFWLFCLSEFKLNSCKDFHLWAFSLPQERSATAGGKVITSI